jgi:hypothetical protein
MRKPTEADHLGKLSSMALFGWLQSKEKKLLRKRMEDVKARHFETGRQPDHA